MQRFANILIAVASFSLASAPFAHAGDQTKIVGSSTVSGFANLAQKKLASGGIDVTIETTGTGGGFSLFCASKDPNFAPITMASRPIKSTETTACEDYGVGPIEEHMLGLSGIVLITKGRKRPMDLRREDLFLALAAQTPAEDGSCRLEANQRKTWRDVRDDLPNRPIVIFGPPATSGTRASFIDLALKTGAAKNECMRKIKADDPDAYKKAATTLRKDQAWVDAGENDVVIIEAVRRLPDAIGVAGFPVYVMFQDLISSAAIDGIYPSTETISDHSYPLSRALRLYAKSDALSKNAAAKAFIKEMTSDRAIGPGGYLIREGLTRAAE